MEQESSPGWNSAKAISPLCQGAQLSDLGKLANLTEPQRLPLGYGKVRAYLVECYLFL